jgi:hypothetical protein
MAVPAPPRHPRPRSGARRGLICDGSDFGAPPTRLGSSRSEGAPCNDGETVKLRMRSPSGARWHVRRLPGATATVFLLLAATQGAWAQTAPAEYCRQIGTDDALRAVPLSLVPTVVGLFHLKAMPVKQVARSTYFRCADRHILLCTIGANLHCGKAETRRDLPGVKAWCVEHAGSQNIPAYVTGHATIYQWHCDGLRPVASRSALSVDPRGFIAQNWKKVDSN